MNKHPYHLLVIDDDDRLRELLRRYLSDHNFNVTLASNTQDARQQMKHLIFDLLIVDVLMPGENGLDFVKSLRHLSSQIPILMLTAMGEPEQRLEGFEAGVNDYLSKPFEPKELLIRIQNILGRNASEQNGEDNIVNLGAFKFDIGRGELWHDDKHIKLTGSEVTLLQTLSGRLGRVVRREALMSLCEIEGEERAVDVLVTRLRRKIEQDPKNPRYLLTVRGKGYTLRPDLVKKDVAP